MHMYDHCNTIFQMYRYKLIPKCMYVSSYLYPYTGLPKGIYRVPLSAFLSVLISHTLVRCHDQKHFSVSIQNISGIDKVPMLYSITKWTFFQSVKLKRKTISCRGLRLKEIPFSSNV